MIFLSVEQVISVHDQILEATGIGVVGIKDANTLASGVDRAENKAFYEPNSDIASLAAAVCFGIAQAHGFRDGNKRTAALCCEIFLNLNGLELNISDAQFADWIVDLVANSLSEDGLASRLRPLLMPAPNFGDNEDDQPNLGI